MGATAVFTSILTLLAGIGIFLIACGMMSSNLESASSEKLKILFSKASKSKLVGVGIGTLGTAAIQSSGATTVMTIGFVNAGIMSLTQAATVIYGANIGTTVTAQIVALGMFGGGGISTSIIFSSFAGVGAFMAMFSKKDSWKRIGGILTGFGMLFVGLEMMSESMSGFAALESVKTFLASIDNVLLLVLLGAVFTAIIQSSSVMTSIAIAMVVTGLIKLDQGIYLTMGSNIGSCVVAILAGITSSKNAKRTAMIHLLFNCSGVLIFLAVGWILSLVTGGSVSFGSIFEDVFPGVPQTQLAMFHTFFNVATVIIILPLTSALVSFVCRILPDDKVEDDGTFHFTHLDTHMLSTPPVAATQTKMEVLNMASLAMQNFNISLDIIKTLDYSRVEEFRQREAYLDWLNSALTGFVVQLVKQSGLSELDHKYLVTTFRSIHDIERVGDYAENIIEFADELKLNGEHFSGHAFKEIEHMRDMINELHDKAMKAYADTSVPEYEEAYIVEEQIDDFRRVMEHNHIERMAKGICTPNIGAQYLSLATSAERIADHLINVAKTVREVHE
ncbi:MAG: Na/Pi cotransporter family protein [Bacteroidales bacterium]|nr:Na/Pi cotransporter family protein [Bacteroidales bacterium]